MSREQWGCQAVSSLTATVTATTAAINTPRQPQTASYSRMVQGDLGIRHA